MAGSDCTARSLVHCRHCGMAHHVNEITDTAKRHKINVEIIWHAWKSWGCSAVLNGTGPCTRTPVVSAQLLAEIRRRYERCQS